MKPVTRRTIMAGAAPVAVVPVVGRASASEDAKLVRLWEEWKAEQIRCKELIQRLWRGRGHRL
jgi:hypothetical protein